MFKKIRVFILLVILASVALGTWRANSRITSWQNTVHVAIYPIAADNSANTARFIADLNAESFADIGEWVQDESRRYGRDVLQPVVVRVAAPVSGQPPLPPEHGSTLDIAIWSLKLRWWASRNDKIDGPTPQIRLFVLFHDPDITSAPPHSTGLSKGQIGLIHAFASRMQKRQNNVVIAHEMLHTFGASDKYDLATGLPIYPQGYAEPQRQPRHPQKQAEIMGGRRPIDANTAEIPASLAYTLIGPETAAEIGLSRRP